ncbi:tubby C-terminal-like domain-containing protein [Phyllosticta citricarpa]|uniref:Tubby C-terminal-like domain-containing protein n=2 Tax=Phyllosticta TaxID=121621 RepID=A0ABR1LNI5_9PEZI
MTTHDDSTQLPQYSAQLGLFPEFIAQKQEKLDLKESISWSGSDAVVKTFDGRKLLQIEGKAMSLSSRKHVKDAQGRDLFTIRKHLWKCLPSYYLEDPSGNRICEVSGNWSFVSQRATCTFVSIGGKSETLSLKGRWTQTGAEIKHEPTGQTVANITRRISARDLLVNSQAYWLFVAPNVDMALMVAICVCLDDRNTNSA